MKVSERIYRILLKAYPARYRRTYEEQMAQLFGDQLRCTGGAGALLALWLRTLADLLRTLPARHLERLHRTTGFGGYNQSARRSVFFARYTSAWLGHESITAEDLLAGVLREDCEIRGWLGSPATDALFRAIGIDGKPRRRVVGCGSIPFDEAARQILSLARQEAERGGAKRITARHVAAGIVRQGQSSAADLLCREGIDLSRLRSGEF